MLNNSKGLKLFRLYSGTLYDSWGCPVQGQEVDFDDPSNSGYSMITAELQEFANVNKDESPLDQGDGEERGKVAQKVT